MGLFFSDQGNDKPVHEKLSHRTIDFKEFSVTQFYPSTLAGSIPYPKAGRYIISST